ncbi:MAG: tetratricopeptide repeat protein [Treponema sp.]|jgi:cytochrome c-type biogenesis protein CcmH/NrfG|nr:tetratricopeptide repeat protein [Treponema sp.]
MSNVSEKISITDHINNFVQKNRKRIFIFLGAVILLLAVFIAAVSIMGVLRNKAISGVEDFTRRYEVLRFDINEPSKEAEVETLLNDLTGFAEKNSGYAAGRAWFIIGGIRADKKEWQEAENAYTGAAKAAAKTYLAPAAYFNAAAAAEEQGNLAGAVDLYTQCVSLSALFPAAARAQFAIGRLKEAQNDKAAALEAYRGVISGWPADTAWTNLAHSRIILLERDEEISQ